MAPLRISEEHETGCPSDLEIASSESPQPDLEEVTVDVHGIIELNTEVSSKPCLMTPVLVDGQKLQS